MKKQSLNWRNIIFFAASPVVAILGTWWVIQQGGPPMATWVLAATLFCVGGLGTTGGYHRLFSHRAYQAAWLVRFLYLLFGSSTLEGSARWWAWEHRLHHRYQDQDKDPYGIQKGFWYAHIGWLLRKTEDPEDNDSLIRDLDQDPLIRWQDRYITPLSLFMTFLLPVAISSLWEDPWGGLFIGGFLRLVVNQHTTFCINSICHYIGKQTYSDKHSARDSWISALVTFGEGYHNFHHEFQSDFRNGIRAYHWDPTKWMIQFLSWLGLAKNLHRVHWDRILQAKLMMSQKRFSKKLAFYPDGVRERAQELFLTAQKRLQQAQEQFYRLREEYRETKRIKLEHVSDQISHLRSELQRAKREFKQAMADWREIVTGVDSEPTY